MGVDREFAGAAAVTTLSAPLAQGGASFSITSATGWPTGTGTDQFVVVFDPDGTTEEKVLCESRSSTTVTVASGGRGYDGTSDQAHATGVTVRICIDTTWLQAVNEHYNDTAQDQHTQYLNTARHDITARHTFGAALGTPAAAAATVSSASSASAGAGSVPARSDHVHALTAASIVNADVNASAAIALSKLATDPLARANHTGTQVSTTISDFTEAAQDAVGAAMTDGTTVDFTYNDGANTISAEVKTLGQSNLASGYRMTYEGTSAPASPAEGDLWADTTNDRLNIYDGAAWQRLGNYSATGRTGGSWSHSGAESFTNATEQAITWTAEATDSDGFLTPTSAVITIPAGLGGLYTWDLTVTWASNPTWTGGLYVFKYTTAVSAADLKQGVVPANFSGSAQQGASGTIRCAAADKVEFWAVQNSGGPLNLSAASLNFTRIGL